MHCNCRPRPRSRGLTLLVAAAVPIALAVSVAMAASAASVAVAQAPPPLLDALDGGAESLPAPLSAQAFTYAVLARNADLAAMRQAVVAAVAQIGPAGALEDPRMSVSAAPRTFDGVMGPSGDIEISQALPWWGTLAARKDVARAQAAAAGYDRDALRLRLTALARGAFSDWVYVRRALDINSANQSVLGELRSIARIRYTTGQAPQTDVLQADVERGLLKQQRLEWQRQRALVQARMNALLDRLPQAEIPPPAPLPATVTLQAEERLAQRALAHPQLERLQADEQAAQASERLAKKERYPKFAVSAGYDNMWPDPAMRPMAGVSFSVPLDQGKYRDEIDAAHAQTRRAASNLENETMKVLADVASDYASVQESAQSLALYRDELVPLARATLAVARTEYGSGRGGFLDVLTAEQHRLETELGLARTQSEYFQRLAELEAASGGNLLSNGSDESGAGPGVAQ